MAKGDTVQVWEPGEKITVRFSGGPRDGTEFLNDSGDAGEHEVALWLGITDGGKVGQRIKGASDAGIEALRSAIDPENPGKLKHPFDAQLHIYRITENREEAGRKVVIFEYEGVAGDETGEGG